MKFLHFIYSFFVYFKCYTPVRLATEVVPCEIPFMSETCYGPLRNRFACWIDFLSQSVYIKCQDSFKSLAFRSTNLLLLYPPFIETVLNHSQFNHNLIFSIDFHRKNTVYDIDLRSLNRIDMNFNLTVYTWIYSNPMVILFRTHTWYKRMFFSVFDGLESGFRSHWQISSKKGISMKTNDVICYHLTAKNISYSKDGYLDIDYTCPSDQCSHQNRLCLGLTPCLNMGDDILLCQIDRLRSNDQFNTKMQFISTDVVVTTSDTDRQTLHRFSSHLFSSCIAMRLIVIVIHGRLEIPFSDLKSSNCSSGLVCWRVALFSQINSMVCCR